MPSNSILTIFILIVQLGTLASGQTSQSATTAPCEITVKLDKRAYSPGEPVRIQIVTRNSSARGTALGDPESIPKIAVMFDSERLPDSRYAKAIAQRRHDYRGSSYGITLRGEQVYSQDLLLSRWVDLTVAGKYAVGVSCIVAEIGDKEFNHLVESNTLTFEIKEGG